VAADVERQILLNQLAILDTLQAIVRDLSGLVVDWEFDDKQLEIAKADTEKCVLREWPDRAAEYWSDNRVLGGDGGSRGA
jgi:hypothetical protein